MDISFFRKTFQDPQKRQNAMVAVLFFSALAGFVFVYFHYYRIEAEVVQIEGAGAIGGKIITSSEASKEIIDKIERDIKNLQTELKNDFYTKLREYKPAIADTAQPGRANPFTP